MDKVTKIALLGLGTVGGGVYKVIQMQQEEMERKLGTRVEIKKILVRNIAKAAIKVKDASVLTNNVDEIMKDPEIRVVVEVMGGVEPAYTFVKKCLLAGKSVATSNKEFVAVHGPELIRIAREGNINFFFEASAGGGIPVIRPLNTSITADDVTEITGILNGTTNYILTKIESLTTDMEDSSISFVDVMTKFAAKSK